MSEALYPKFRFLQDRPEEICQIPPLEVEEREITHNTPACLFGIGSILRRYAGLPHDFPVQVSVEHFINYQTDKVIRWDIDAGFRTYLAVDSKRAALYKEAGMERTHPIGSALHYALRLYEKMHGRLPKPERRRGTLVFPHKSDSVTRLRYFDHGPMVRWMNSLPEEFHPVYVCLYWMDYLKGDAIPYGEAGYPVLSCGHWMHEDFLLRFVDMCGQFRYVCANSFSSTFPLSVLCGCHFMYLETGGHVEQRIGGERIVHATDPTRNTIYGEAAFPITPHPPVAEHRQEQLALARHMSGFRHVRSRWWMWWILRKEARHTCSLRRHGLDFSGGALGWDAMRPWDCRGIERDGWLHSEVSLLVPVTPKARMLVMHLDLPDWAELASQHMVVHVPGRKDGTIDTTEAAERSTGPVTAAAERCAGAFGIRTDISAPKREQDRLRQIAEVYN